MPERIPQSVVVRVPLQAYLSSDHITPATGKTIAVTISKNGAAYGNPSGGATNATEIGSGSYYVDLSTTDAGTLGPLLVLGTASGVDNVVAICRVVDANNAGLASLDAAVSTRATPAQILTTNLAESYAANTAPFTLSQGMYMLWAYVASKKIIGTTLTAYKVDTTTPAMTFTLDSTTPTQQLRAT